MNKPNLSFVKWPSADDILQSMNQLQSEPIRINSENANTVFLWSRFDPRLSEQLVHFYKFIGKDTIPYGLDIETSKAKYLKF